MAVDQPTFAKKVERALRRRGVVGEISFDPATFSLAVPDGKLFLANLYADWSAAGWFHRRRVLTHYLSALALSKHVPTDPATLRAGLRIQLRDAAWLAANRRRFGPEHAGALPATPLCPELALTPVFDGPTSMASLDQQHLDQVGLTVEEAVHIGRANLRASSSAPFKQIRPGVFAAVTGDSYDASRLVLTELISRLDLRGDPVAFVPSREHLMLTGADDADGLAAVAAVTRPLIDQPRALTGHAFVWRGGAWSVFLPPAAHPAHQAMRALGIITDARAAAEQKELLEAEQADDADLPFIASFTVLEHEETGALTSYCVWTEGVDALLPRTDLVYLLPAAPDGSPSLPVQVTWAEAVAKLGHLMVLADDLCPPRWRVATFPTASERAALTAPSEP